MRESGEGQAWDRLVYLREKKSLANNARERMQVVFERLAGELYEAIGEKWPDAADYFMVLKNGLDALDEDPADEGEELPSDTQRIKSLLGEFEEGLGVSYSAIFDEEDFDELAPTYLGLMFKVSALDQFLAGELRSEAEFYVVVELDAEQPERASVSLESFDYLELEDMRLVGGCLEAWYDRAVQWLEARSADDDDPAG